ncbi:unnamed protein product [Amoebophrya sp. A120]|nr:unnamed protein product [Amoebophrya sp. A120]|eukprot:GSA120T00019643001.1
MLGRTSRVASYIVEGTKSPPWTQKARLRRGIFRLLPFLQQFELTLTELQIATSRVPVLRGRSPRQRVESTNGVDRSCDFACSSRFHFSFWICHAKRCLGTRFRNSR